MSQIWYITGCSSGMGLALAERLVEQGCRVAGTSRSLQKISSLEISKHSNFLGLEVDIVSAGSVRSSIAKTLEHFGGLDVVVNCAGYGLLGSVEEVTVEEQRALFDALYFGPLNVIQAYLPHLRSKRSGYIFNISSIAGFRSVARFGAYNGAKFALTGMSEALAEDVKPFGIKVSNVILGVFNTNFISALDVCQNTIQEYDTIGSFVAPLKEALKTRVKGKPELFADILIEYSRQESLPCNLFIGPQPTFTAAEDKITQLSGQVSSQKEKNSKVN